MSDFTDSEITNILAELKHAKKELTTLRTRLAEVEATLNHTLTSNEEGTLQWWIQKHDALALNLAELLVKYATVEADAAVMREALSAWNVWALGALSAYGYPAQDRISTITVAALATNAGKSLLEWKREADYLLRHAGDPTWSLNYEQSKDWFKRRHAFLNPTNNDVK